MWTINASAYNGTLLTVADVIEVQFDIPSGICTAIVSGWPSVEHMNRNLERYELARFPFPSDPVDLYEKARAVVQAANPSWEA